MYRKKQYAHFNLMVYMGISLTLIGLAAISCSTCKLYNWNSNLNDDTVNISLDKGYPFQVNEKGMTPLCKAAEDGDYQNFKVLLNSIPSPCAKISGDIVYLITGYNSNKDTLHIEKALLHRVIISDDPEILAHKAELLDILCDICLNHGLELNQIFAQKHGKEGNTIIHLAVDQGMVEPLACLVDYYLRNSNNDIHGLIRVCNISNRLGKTPIWMLIDMLYNGILTCGHMYRSECENDEQSDDCENELFMASQMSDILIYLIKLGVPWCDTEQTQKRTRVKSGTKIKSVFHYVLERNDADLFKAMLKSIKKRTTNKIQAKELLNTFASKGLSLLSHAVINRNYEGVNYLIDLGACPMTADGKGIFPLFYALGYADTKMVQCLLASPCILEGVCNINQQGKNKLTAISLAQSPQHGGIITTLLALREKVKKIYRRELVPDGWDWKPKQEIINLITHAGIYFFPTIMRGRFQTSYSMLVNNSLFGKTHKIHSYQKEHGHCSNSITNNNSNSIPNKRRKFSVEESSLSASSCLLSSFEASNSSDVVSALSSLSPWSIESFTTPSPFMGG